MPANNHYSNASFLPTVFISALTMVNKAMADIYYTYFFLGPQDIGNYSLVALSAQNYTYGYIHTPAQQISNCHGSLFSTIAGNQTTADYHYVAQSIENSGGNTQIVEQFFHQISSALNDTFAACITNSMEGNDSDIWDFFKFIGICVGSIYGVLGCMCAVIWVYFKLAKSDEEEQYPPLFPTHSISDGTASTQEAMQDTATAINSSGGELLSRSPSPKR